MANNWTPKIVGGIDIMSDQPRAATAGRTSGPAKLLAVDGLPANLYSESFFALPFVTLPPEGFTNWEEFWDRVDMWNDEPTGNACEDYHRGRRYARNAIEATRQENASSRGLEIVVEKIIERAFRRRGPKGHMCRKLSDAELGFLDELCKIASKP
jgi:hypothetical protein